VWDGVWWAAATITTVGYGDKAPTSTRGRIVAMIAMLASLFLVGAFVTEVSRDVATQRSEQGITSVDTIGNRSVAVVDGSTFAEYVESQGVNTIALPNQSEAFDAVAAGTADVVLASPFALSNLGDEHGVRAVGTVLYEEFESFGLTQGSPWREPINAVLADLQSTGVIQATIDRWID
jgi:ABC-type amino acid transport substrate-binding protein